MGEGEVPPAGAPSPPGVGPAPGAGGGDRGGGRLGLVGAAKRTGLGYMNRDIALHLGVDRWLVSGPADDTAGGLPCLVEVAAPLLSVAPSGTLLAR